MTTAKQKKAQKAESSLKLFDFRKQPVYTIRGEFGIRWLDSKDKTRKLVVLEGPNNSLISGGKGINGKNIWIGVCPTRVPDNADDSFIDFGRAYAHILQGEYKVYRGWSQQKSKWFLRIDHIEKEDDCWILGFSGDDGERPWMRRVENANKNSNATIEDAIQS